MPKINRFRIVNFRYDDDKKYIANEIFEFDGKNALLNLENGGGKSVILQLALQVVLPNTSMGSRNFSDYFKPGASPTHIMVEWKLDGIMGEYLLTGICVSKNADGLRFFTYTHKYTLPHDLDINGLEAINGEKQVIGFSEYQSYLKKLSSEMRLNINVYSRDRQREYRDKLYTFNLFKEEYEAIKVINQSEGGIDKFFENARKSRNVIEKLIIPNIPQQEGDVSGILAETFKKHLENLKNIPTYQHNIKMYEAFCEKASKLLSELYNYGVTVDEINSISRDILTLSNLITIASDRLYTESGNLKHNDNEFAARIEELSYKRESLDYKNVLIELESIGVKHEEVSKEIMSLEDKIKKCKEKINFMESAVIYEEVIKARNEILLYKAQLDTLSKKKNDIDREYQNYIYYAKVLLEEEIKKIEKNLDDLKNERDALSKEKVELEIKVKEKNIERDSVRDLISSIRTRLKDKKERLDQITSYFAKDLTLLAAPSEGLLNLTKDKDELINKIESLEKEIKEISNLMEDLSIKENRIKESTAALRQKKDNLDEKIGAFEKDYSKINKEISMYEISEDVYSKEAYEALNALKIKMDNSLSDVLGRYHELLKRKYLFDGSEYYIPDMELKKVCEYLKDQGIRCIPGSLWLRNQREDLREALLHQNPLLCHSIIIDKQELETRDGSLFDGMPELVESYPVTFIVDSEEGIMAPKDSPELSKGIDRLGSMEMYVVYSKNNALALDSELFKAYLKGMDQNISGLKAEYEGMKKDVEKITGLMERCREFVKSYPEGWLKETKSHSDAILENIKKNDDTLNDIKEKRELFDKKSRENRVVIEQTNELIKEKEKDIENLTLYMELKDEVAKLNKDLRAKEQMLTQIDDEIRIFKEKIDSILKNIENVKNSLNANSRLYEDKRRIYSEIAAKLSIQKPEMQITGTLEEILSTARGLEVKIADRDGEHIRKFIEKSRKTEENGLSKIRSKGFDESDFEGMTTFFTEEEIEEERKIHTSLKSEVNELEGIERKYFGNIEKLKGKEEIQRKEIQKKYNLQPFEFESIEGIDKISFNEQIDAYRKKKQKNAKKLEEVEIRRGKLVEYQERLEEYINYNNISIEASSRENMDSLVYKGESISLWDILKYPVEEISIIANEIKNYYREATNNLKTMQSDIRESYNELYGEATWTENMTIKLILDKIMKSDMYNYKYVKGLFEDILDSVENMKKAAEFQLNESLKDKEEIVERCYSKAEAIYEELKSVDTFSKIKINDTTKKTIVIEMPSLHPEEGKALMARYIEESISEIEKMKAEGKYDVARIDSEIAKIMSPVRLLDAVTSLNEYSIKVFKPESTVGASRYIPWEVVISWSGGEKLAGFFAMFISIISYLRYKKTGWQGSSKVIWIDNPFGQANASYLLSYIFELAKATNTQLICLTGHMQVDIYMQFDVVYSLLHRMLTGMNMSVIQSNLIKSNAGLESAAYKVKHEQMTLF